ncbi:MAG: MFS transporter [Candidatus Marinimicrobia bacterium]|nr:MFS transporter [Candidatus Neomarinimicrobiota bacterium]
MKLSLKNIDKRLYPLMLGWLINSLGFGAIVPFMTVYFNTIRDVPMTTIAFFFLAAAIGRTVAQSVGGAVSDKIGRKGLMVWSQLSRAVIFLFAGIAIAKGSTVWVLAGIILSQYWLSSFFQPVASAMIADILPPKERSNGYALMRMAGNIGWGTGPAIGGFLFDVSYQSLFYFTSATFLVAGLFVFFTIKETVDTTVRPNGTMVRAQEPRGFGAMAAAFKRDKVFLFFCVVALLLFLTWGQFVSTLSVFMKKGIGMSSTQIGWIYAFNAGLVIIFQYFITQWTKKKNHFILMMIGSLFFVFSYAFMGWINSFGMMLFVMVFITFGEMFAGPSGNTIASNMAKRGQYGKYQGIYSSISTLGWSLGPFIGGIMMDIIPNMKIFWLTMSSFGLLAFFGFLYLYYKKGEHAE